MALADTARLIAALELQDKFTGPAKRAESSIGSLDKKMSSLGNAGQKLGAGIGSAVSKIAKLGAVTIGVGLAAATTGIALAVNAASDLNEEIDKSGVVFGKSAGKVKDFADNAASIGLSSAEALGAAGNFGNMLNTIGLAQDESADMSVTMVQLAADMASFNNEDPTDMLDRLRSGLAGEAEPLRRFGVLLSEAEVKNFAYRNGLAKTGDELTEAQKVQARYGLILEQTSIQQGNYADTADSLANQQRTLRANFANTAATIGQTFLPIASKLVKAINEIFVQKRPQIREFTKEIGQALENVFTDSNIQKGIDGVGKFIDKIASFEGGEFASTLDQLKEGSATGTLGTVAASIESVVERLKELPWQAIGDAARLLGTGSKALLDAFLGLPPWVQTAVLTGWGLNKLTGGALGSIVTELGKGLVKGVLNMNAAVVNVNAKTVTGGGFGGAGGGGGLGGLLTSILATFGIGATVAGGTSAVIDAASGDPNKQAQAGLDIIGGFPALIGRAVTDALVESGLLGEPDKPTPVEVEPSGPVKDIVRKLQDADRGIERVDAQIESAKTANVVNRQAVVAGLTAQREKLVAARQAILDGNRTNYSGFQNVGGLVRDSGRILNGVRANSEAQTSRLSQVRDGVRTSNATLAQIRAKRTSVNVTANFNASVVVAAQNVVSQVQAFTRTRGGVYVD